jgi:hypothetical protein
VEGLSGTGWNSLVPWPYRLWLTWWGHIFSEQQSKTQTEIEEQRAQYAASQAYLDQMSQLLLATDLRNCEEGSEVRTLARP